MKTREKSTFDFGKDFVVYSMLVATIGGLKTIYNGGNMAFDFLSGQAIESTNLYGFAAGLLFTTLGIAGTFYGVDALRQDDNKYEDPFNYD